jgi:hypothetical protein
MQVDSVGPMSTSVTVQKIGIPPKKIGFVATKTSVSVPKNANFSLPKTGSFQITLSVNEFVSIKTMVERTQHNLKSSYLQCISQSI